MHYCYSHSFFTKANSIIRKVWQVTVLFVTYLNDCSRLWKIIIVGLTLTQLMQVKGLLDCSSIQPDCPSLLSFNSKQQLFHIVYQLTITPQHLTLPKSPHSTSFIFIIGDFAFEAVKATVCVSNTTFCSSMRSKYLWISHKIWQVNMLRESLKLRMLDQQHLVVLKAPLQLWKSHYLNFFED